MGPNVKRIAVIAVAIILGVIALRAITSKS